MDIGVKSISSLVHSVKTQQILEITPLGSKVTKTEVMLCDRHNIYLTLSPFFILVYDLWSQIL
jgi:hypothetical protein